MDDVARIISTDEGQSVELPEAYRFDAETVRIRWEGDRVVLERDDAAIDTETGLTVGRLRELIQEGLDSGPDEPWDPEEIKREVRAELAAERLAR